MDKWIKTIEINKIDQKELDKAWDLFIKNIPNNLSNKRKEKFIQLRDKLQKEINEKGYANIDIDNPKFIKWWLNE